MAGLSAGAYLGSKVIVLGLLSVVQTVIIVVVGLLALMPPHGSVIGPAFIDITCRGRRVCLVSMLVGLTVSALVTKGEQTIRSWW